MTAPASRARKSLAAQTAVAKHKAASPDRRFLADNPTSAEPSLKELLQDPIMQHLMRSDGVDPQHLHDLLRDARARL
jgi:hypothetical protein